MRPLGTVPKAVIETLRGPSVRSVSPPISEQPNAACARSRPPAKAASHPRSGAPGSASDRTYASGVAPLATRSETLTASAFHAMAPGSSPGMKCTPAIRPSVVTTRSCPGSGVIAAQSSLRPNAPAKPAARGAQNSAMIASSLCRSAGFAVVMAVELTCAQPPRQLVEHAVHDLRLVALEEGDAPRRCTR